MKIYKGGKKSLTCCGTGIPRHTMWNSGPGRGCLPKKHQGWFAIFS